MYLAAGRSPVPMSMAQVSRLRPVRAAYLVELIQDSLPMGTTLIPTGSMPLSATQHARFTASVNAPAGNVGIFCGDLVSLLGAAATNCASFGAGNNQLLSFNALNAPQGCDPRGFLRGSACTVLNLVPITTNDARYIINMHTAQKVSVRHSATFHATR